jgi:hypothetical protein
MCGDGGGTLRVRSAGWLNEAGRSSASLPPLKPSVDRNRPEPESITVMGGIQLLAQRAEAGAGEGTEAVGRQSGDGRGQFA